MGNQYYIWNKKCPYCSKIVFESVYEDYAINITLCEHCKKEIRVDIKSIFSKTQKKV